LSEERIERRLTAILTANVVSYSRLMGADEEGTFAALKAIPPELVNSRIVEHRAASSKPLATGFWSRLPASSMRCAARSTFSATFFIAVNEGHWGSK
jgi:adenylate cyclase